MPENTPQQLILPNEFSGCQIFTGQNAVTPVLQDLEEQGILRRFRAGNVFTPRERSSEQPSEVDYLREERGIAAQSAQNASGNFERNRQQVRMLLKAIVRSVFDAADLNPGSGLDVGSGASGEMWAELIPRKLQPSFVQMDMNPGAIALNQQKNPQAVVRQGSYLHLTDMAGMTRNSIDLITGLSTLDATLYPERAVQQMLEVLKPGGHIIHFQDVRPGVGVVADEVRRTAAQEGYHFDDLELLVLPETDNTQAPVILAFVLPEGMVPVVEIFRRRMQRVFENASGGHIKLNDWVVARRPCKRGVTSGTIYHQNMRLAAMTPGTIFDEASGVVTLVQKVAQ